MVVKTGVDDDETLCTYGVKRLIDYGIEQVPVIGDLCYNS